MDEQQMDEQQMEPHFAAKLCAETLLHRNSVAHHPVRKLWHSPTENLLSFITLFLAGG